MKKTKLWLVMLALVLAFGMTVVGCEEDSTVNSSKWWTWESTQKESNYDATAHVRITPTSDDTGCNVKVTGSPNKIYYNWATQVGIDYTATAGKTYKVTWKWQADTFSFDNVTIRYAQQKDYKNDSAYEPSYLNRITIPTTEETRTCTFTMPANCFTNFTFNIGEDNGNFVIRDFKIEEVQ